MTVKKTNLEFLSYFNELEDPRIDRKKLHSLSDILLILFCGAICGAESWRDFVRFGEAKLDYLRRFTPLENGIPSKSTFSRVVSLLKPEAFERCFINWVDALQENIADVIAIDGKTLRRSFDKSCNKSAIHRVSAFAANTRLVLGQKKVDEKSNEITAIPKLLKSLEIQGAIITIDAMGCQKEIAKTVNLGEADYVLALKANQEGLYEQVKHHFSNFFDMSRNKYVDHHKKIEKNRGRIETRECLMTENIDWLKGEDKWSGLKSIIAVKSQRTINGKTATDYRYFISSLESNAEVAQTAIRAHWAIENSLHWVMDMVFREDESRVRLDNSAENMSVLKHAALNQLQRAKPKFKKDASIKGLRKMAGWDHSVLDRILCA